MSATYTLLVLVINLLVASCYKLHAVSIVPCISVEPEIITSCIEPLPDEAAYVARWIEEHATMLKFLATTPHPLSSWEDKKTRGNKCLLKNGLENLGSNNYVFRVPHSDWFIKISGPLRRLVNLYVYSTNSDPYTPAEYKRHKQFSNKRLLNTLAVVPTYVTISRFANALLCTEICRTKKITRVHFPEIYLVHIPGCPWNISDDNYIILEKEILSIENIYSHERESKSLTKKALRELYTIITHCGLFDFNGENLQIDGKNNLVFIDLEQGMVENPSHFFNKNTEMFDYRVYEGLTSFAETHLTNFPEKYEYFRSLIQKDSSLRSSTEWENIKEYFSLNYRRKNSMPHRKRNMIHSNSIKTLEQLLALRAQAVR